VGQQQCRGLAAALGSTVGTFLLLRPLGTGLVADTQVHRTWPEAVVRILYTSPVSK
jgi:hypothetical protein